MLERKYKIDKDTGRLVSRAEGVPVPEDEPLFILRAQDRNALPMLMAYHAICQDLNHQGNVIKSINDFDEFRKKYPDRMKEPDS
jgi:hypothetical protein